MQNQNAELLKAFQRCLDEGMQARDEEMLKFESATNRALMDLKNWVLRKKPSGDYTALVGPGPSRLDDSIPLEVQKSLGNTPTAF